MTINDFITKYNGKTKGYPTDNDYKGECLSIVKLWMKEKYNFNPPASGTNSAYGYWSNFPNPLSTYYTKVANTPDLIPKPEWIPIWNTKTGNGYGHIEIVADDTASKSYFTSFGQNWNGRHAHLTKHSYQNVVGFLVPKKEQSMSDTISIEKKVFEELVTKASKFDEFAKLGYTSATQIDQQLKELKKSASDAKANAKTEANRADAARKDFNHLISESAKALNTQQEITQVIAALAKLDKQLDELDDLQKQFASLQLESGKQAEELRAEIARLEALIKASDSLAGATFEQLLAEFLRRIKNVLAGRTV